MRSRVLNKILFYTISCAFFLIECLSSAGQTRPTKKPFMWVEMKQGQDQRRHFDTLKLDKIGQASRTVQTDSFLLQNFWGFVEYLDTTYKSAFQYLHVYIGIGKGKKFVQLGLTGKLVLIFAPASSRSVRSDLKYYILSTKFDPSHVKRFEVLPKENDSCNKKFIASMPLETIDETDPDNQFPNGAAQFQTPSDTRYVTYCAADLRVMMNVKKYYQSQSVPISDDMVGYLGAYLETSTHKNRILTQFEFMATDGSIFDLDSIKEFKDLRDKDTTACPLKVKRKFTSDNGQLCPTYCQ